MLKNVDIAIGMIVNPYGELRRLLTNLAQIAY